MQQYTYEEQERLVERQIKPKNFLFLIMGVIGLIVIIIIVMVLVNIANKGNTCTSIEELIGEKAIEYIGEEKIILNVVNPSVTISLDQLYEDGLDDVLVNDSICGGEVKITKVGDTYITTPNLTNCDFCTTETRYGDWSNPKNSISNAPIVDVIISYNYVEKQTNYTSWTKYYTPEQLENDPFESHEDNRLDDISEDAKNIQIVPEDKNYYRYQDLKWKFYKNNVSYSALSSVQPSGYQNKDTSTAVETEWSEWSLDYPEEYDYRDIDTKTGYRWYYEEDGNKIYYNDGAYYPTQPNDKYTERDDDRATVYSYQDTMWKWYNNTKRVYSSYMSEATSTYPYKDTDLTSISSYSSWKEESSVNSSNEDYRIEEIEVRTRYRVKYDLYSFNKIDEYVEASEFEELTGYTLQEIYDSNEYELIVKYEYITKK